MGGGRWCSYQPASDHLLSAIICRGQSSYASEWLCDWLRKGEMKTTVNFWPQHRSCRNAQPLLWCGGTEPALFLCLLHQSNRDCGEVGEGGHTQREGREKMSKRKEGKRISAEQGCGLKIEGFFPPSWNLHLGGKKKKKKNINFLLWSLQLLKVLLCTELHMAKIFFDFKMSVCTIGRGQHRSRTVPGSVPPDKSLFCLWLMTSFP